MDGGIIGSLLDEHYYKKSSFWSPNSAQGKYYLYAVLILTSWILVYCVFLLFYHVFTRFGGKMWKKHFMNKYILLTVTAIMLVALLATLCLIVVNAAHLQKKLQPHIKAQHSSEDDIGGAVLESIRDIHVFVFDKIINDGRKYSRYAIKLLLNSTKTALNTEVRVFVDRILTDLRVTSVFELSDVFIGEIKLVHDVMEKITANRDIHTRISNLKKDIAMLGSLGFYCPRSLMETDHCSALIREARTWEVAVNADRINLDSSITLLSIFERYGFDIAEIQTEFRGQKEGLLDKLDVIYTSLEKNFSIAEQLGQFGQIWDDTYALIGPYVPRLDAPLFASIHIPIIWLVSFALFGIVSLIVIIVLFVIIVAHIRAHRQTGNAQLNININRRKACLMSPPLLLLCIQCCVSIVVYIYLGTEVCWSCQSPEGVARLDKKLDAVINDNWPSIEKNLKLNFTEMGVVVNLNLSKPHGVMKRALMFCPEDYSLLDVMGSGKLLNSSQITSSQTVQKMIEEGKNMALSSVDNINVTTILSQKTDEMLIQAEEMVKKFIENNDYEDTMKELDSKIFTKPVDLRKWMYASKVDQVIFARLEAINASTASLRRTIDVLKDCFAALHNTRNISHSLKRLASELNILKNALVTKTVRYSIVNNAFQSLRVNLLNRLDASIDSIIQMLQSEVGRCRYLDRSFTRIVIFICTAEIHLKRIAIYLYIFTFLSIIIAGLYVCVSIRSPRNRHSCVNFTMDTTQPMLKTNNKEHV